MTEEYENREERWPVSWAGSSEPWVPEPPPEPHKPDPLPARCPHCFLLVRRMTYEEWFCVDHGIVRAWYGNPLEEER